MMPDPSSPHVKASAVIRNIGQLVTVAQQPVDGATGPLQVISDAAIAVYKGTITWIGPDNDAEPMFQQTTGANKDGITIVDAQGAVVTPGLVDSHTHLVFAGDRAEEFHLRHAGVGYGARGSLRATAARFALGGPGRGLAMQLSALPLCHHRRWHSRDSTQYHWRTRAWSPQGITLLRCVPVLTALSVASGVLP